MAAHAPRRAERTRERILNGAIRAVARHGLSKLDMGDVSVSAGVSRGTLYRYFENRDALLDAVSIQEARRFWERCVEALEAAPEGEARIRLLLEHANRHVREHRALQRMLETDPALVLRAVQREFPTIRGELSRLIAPLLAATPAVAGGTVRVDQCVDWLTRLMISAFLIPDPHPDDMTDGITAVFRLLEGSPT
jgi:AcrR family transcriptional regulator